MKAKSIKGRSTEEIQSALEQCMADRLPAGQAGFKPTLGLVFISIKQDIKLICDLLDKRGIQIFGATTAGEFTDEGVDKGSVAILLLDIDKSCFKIVADEFGDQPVNLVTKRIGLAGLAGFPNPAFIICTSDIKTSGETVIEGFVEVAGNNAAVIGGMAGDDLSLKNEGRVFTNHWLSGKGIVALILDQDKIAIQAEAVSGWKPVGTLKTVTKSEGNWIYTIDDLPALDVLLKFTGAKVDLDTEDDVYMQIGTSFPLQVQQKVGTPVMVPSLFFNRETKAVMCGALIRQGSQIQFSLPPDFDVIDTVIESAKKIKSADFPEADAMIIFSCIGRLQNLGLLVNEEINGIRDVWSTPMAGFFSYGEFGRTKDGMPSFHGTTCCWVALKEK